jgi:hypothetical protein
MHNALNIFKCGCADIEFVYSFCSGNGRAAAAEYESCIHVTVAYHYTFPDVYRTLKETGSFL